MNNGSITMPSDIGLLGDAAAHSNNRKHPRLTPSEYSVFQELRAEYLSLDTTVGHPRAQALADAIIELDLAGRSLSYDDIRALETALVRLEPASRTRERLRAMRRDYAYLNGGTEDLTQQFPSDEGDLKAQVEQLLIDFHTVATNSARNQEICARLFRTVSLSTLVTVICIACLGTVCWFQLGLEKNVEGPLWRQTIWALPYLPTVFYSMVAGTLGSYFSSVLRVQNLAAKRLTPTSTVESVSLLSAGIAPVVGAFAGFLLFTIFASGLVTGEFLPKIEFREYNVAIDLNQLNSGLWGITQAVPVNKIENIKLILAALVSGFSERFFPDVLDWLSKGMSPVGNKKEFESKAGETTR
jgi:hypothetical protein